MKIVMSGYYGFDNVGDEAILFSIIQALREVDSSINITVLSNQPEKTAETYGVDAVKDQRMESHSHQQIRFTDDDDLLFNRRIKRRDDTFL